MIPVEVMKKIRRIEIRTSHVVDDMLGGQYHSAFKGRGIEFEEVRPYQIGDDIRTIDWNVTARTGDPFVKLFREERELTVHLVVDQSASHSLGTQQQSKRELVAELGATLAFSAIKNNDKVGLTLFTDGIEKVVPPAKGTRHVLRVIRELLYCEPIGRGTDITMAMDHVNRTAKRRSVIFLISDFQDNGYQNPLRIARRKHDIIPIVVGDRRESEMPNVGIVELQDAETGKVVVFDTTSRHHRDLYRQHTQEAMEARDHTFRRLKMDPIYINTGEDIIDPLRRFFHKREARR
jgi:uncharacterized protein (DUF58 family)